MFIEQAEKTNIIKEIFKKVKISNNKIFLNLELENANLKIKIKIAQKVKTILENHKIRQVCIEKRLKEDKQFINLIYSNNINICSPKWIFKEKTDEIISKVMGDKKREESEIHICVNEVDLKTEQFIYKFAKQFKKMNIITNHMGKFKKIEEKLFKEEGILINLSNNRRKSLLKAKLILNVDFPKEVMNEFAIYDNSTIINWDEKLKIRKKRFCGKIIEEINPRIGEDSEIVEYVKQNMLEKYDIRDICQVLEINPKGEIIY